MSDVALGLKFPDLLDRQSAVEDVYPTRAVGAFLQFMMLQDIRYEFTPFTKLPSTEGDRRRLEYAKQSQESDDEGLPPTPFCSGCGSLTCKTGADRCRRQRKCERLELVVEHVYENLSAQVERSSSTLTPGSRGSEADRWTRSTAKTRLEEFRRTAVRQLAHMASNKGRRMGERRGRTMKRGC